MEATFFYLKIIIFNHGVLSVKLNMNQNE